MHFKRPACSKEAAQGCCGDYVLDYAMPQHSVIGQLVAVAESTPLKCLQAPLLGLDVFAIANLTPGHGQGGNML